MVIMKVINLPFRSASTAMTPLLLPSLGASFDVVQEFPPIPKGQTLRASHVIDNYTTSINRNQVE